MSEKFGPGTFLIERNDEGKPILRTRAGIPLHDPTFEAAAGEESRFTFEIKAPTPENLFTFAERPITWIDQNGAPMGQPPSIHIVALTIEVTPPTNLPSAERFPFKMHFDVDGHSEALWSADGSKPLDPTVVENPPTN